MTNERWGKIKGAVLEAQSVCALKERHRWLLEAGFWTQTEHPDPETRNAARKKYIEIAIQNGWKEEPPQE